MDTLWISILTVLVFVIILRLFFHRDKNKEEKLCPRCKTVSVSDTFAESIEEKHMRIAKNA